MSRPLRIEFEDALYHVTSRGNRRGLVFVDDTDRSVFLHTVGQGMKKFDATAVAYCLMGNHYHLVLQTHQANLSRLMRHINSIYAQRYNRRHNETGHLFQGRFHAILVQHDAYFLEVCRYVDLNPVRAGMVSQAHDWKWSSYQAHIGWTLGPDWLDSQLVRRALVPDLRKKEGAAAYRRFVSESHGVKLWDAALMGQIYLGDEAFILNMQEKLGNRRTEPEIPLVQRELPRRPLQDYLDVVDRDPAAIASAYLEGGHTQADIARAVGCSRASISRLIARYRATSKT